MDIHPTYFQLKYSLIFITVTKILTVMNDRRVESTLKLLINHQSNDPENTENASQCKSI